MAHRDTGQTWSHQNRATKSLQNVNAECLGNTIIDPALALASLVPSLSPQKTGGGESPVLRREPGTEATPLADPGVLR